MQFDRHTLVLLVLRPDAPELTDEEAANSRTGISPSAPICATVVSSSQEAPLSTRTTSACAASRSGSATPRRRAGSATRTRRCGGTARGRGDDLDGPGGERQLREVSAPRHWPRWRRTETPASSPVGGRRAQLPSRMSLSERAVKVMASKVPVHPAPVGAWQMRPMRGARLGARKTRTSSQRPPSSDA